MQTNQHGKRGNEGKGLRAVEAPRPRCPSSDRARPRALPAPPSPGSLPAQPGVTGPPAGPPRPANLQVQLLEKTGEKPRKPARVHGVEQRHGPADAGRKEGGSEGPWPHRVPAPWRDPLCSPPLHGPPEPEAAAPPELRYLSLSGTMGAAMSAVRPAPDGGLAGPSAAAPLAARAARTQTHGRSEVERNVWGRCAPAPQRAPPYQLDYETMAREGHVQSFLKHPQARRLYHLPGKVHSNA